MRKLSFASKCRLVLSGLILSLGLSVSRSEAACDATTAPTLTTRAGISKPVVNACNWGTTLNRDWDIVDSSMCIQGAANTFTSTNTFGGPIILQTNNPIRFYDASTHYLSFQAPTTAASTQWILPTGDGTAGQVLKTDGASNLSWTTISGGSASTLGVRQSSVTISSPTAAINFIGPPFSVSLVSGNTAQVTLDGSSVTLQGNTFNQANKLVQLNGSTQLPAVDGSLLLNLPTFASTIQNRSTLQSGATFYVSSGSVAGQFSPTSIKWPDGTIQVSSPTSTLISSGVAFGSPSNTITQDTTSFTWNNTLKSLVISSSQSGSGFSLMPYSLKIDQAGSTPYTNIAFTRNGSETANDAVYMFRSDSVYPRNVEGIEFDAPTFGVATYPFASISNNGGSGTGQIWSDSFYATGTNTSSFTYVNVTTETVTYRLGVGMTNPAYPLDVTGDINYSGTLRGSLASIGTEVITPKVYVSGNSLTFGISSDGPNAFSFQNQAGTPFVQMDSSVSSMTVSGNLYASSVTVNNTSYYNKVAAFNSSGVLVSTTVSGGGGSSLSPTTIISTTASNATTSTSLVACPGLSGSFALSNSANKVKVSLSATAQIDSNGVLLFTVYKDGSDAFPGNVIGLASGIPSGSINYSTSAFGTITVGDTSSHTYAIYFKSVTGSTVDLPAGGTATMLIEEVPQ